MSRLLFIVLVGVVLFSIFGAGKFGGDSKMPADVQAMMDGHKVVMLSASWCGYCKSLDQDLRVAGVPFKVWDVEQDAIGRRISERLDIRGVPVTLVGDQIVRGYDPEQVIALARR